MANRTKKNTAKASADVAQTKVNKSAAIREYLSAHQGAKPKEVVAALKERGIDVSPNVVSIVKAKVKIKSARKKRATGDGGPAVQAGQADGLDAALTLYKAAQGRDVPATLVRRAFLKLVETLG